MLFVMPAKVARLELFIPRTSVWQLSTINSGGVLNNSIIVVPVFWAGTTGIINTMCKGSPAPMLRVWQGSTSTRKNVV